MTVVGSEHADHQCRADRRSGRLSDARRPIVTPDRPAVLQPVRFRAGNFYSRTDAASGLAVGLRFAGLGYEVHRAFFGLITGK